MKPQPAFVLYPGGQSGRATPPGPEVQELWFRLARFPWASVVVVPVDGDTSAADVATALADVGASLREAPVTAIVANRVDYRSARTLLDLQPRLAAARFPAQQAATSTVEVEAHAVDAEPEGTGAPRSAMQIAPSGRAIIAIRPVTEEPLGLAIAQAADAVVLCVHLGKSRLADARRTIELVGRERIVGALVIR